MTGPAQVGLAEAGRHVARGDTDGAEAIVDDYRQRCQSLLTFPERFPVAGRWRGVEVRKMPAGPFLVFYTVRDDAVFVVRVLHAARDRGWLDT